MRFAFYILSAKLHRFPLAERELSPAGATAFPNEREKSFRKRKQLEKVRPSGRFLLASLGSQGNAPPEPRRLFEDAEGIVARVLHRLLAKKRVYQVVRGRASEAQGTDGLCSARQRVQARRIG